MIGLDDLLFHTHSFSRHYIDAHILFHLDPSFFERWLLLYDEY